MARNVWKKRFPYIITTDDKVTIRITDHTGDGELKIGCGAQGVGGGGARVRGQAPQRGNVAALPVQAAEQGGQRPLAPGINIRVVIVHEEGGGALRPPGF